MHYYSPGIKTRHTPEQRECRLKSCRKQFQTITKNQVYCCPAHRAASLAESKRKGRAK